MIAKFNRVSIDKPPTLDGRLPVILFELISRFTNRVSNPSDDGILPVRLFEVKSKYVRLVNAPRDDGMDPIRPAAFTLIIVTTPFTVLHVIPLQGDGLVLHTPGDVILFTHFQLVVDDDEIAAAKSHIMISILIELTVVDASNDEESRPRDKILNNIVK